MKLFVFTLVIGLLCTAVGATSLAGGSSISGPVGLALGVGNIFLAGMLFQDIRQKVRRRI